ncbi:MAG: hypothetical protein H0T42_23660 [Deltaproteobacteria bacterium]|nr:hypothetical protein [Deltaproteobacteria bacterium]
MKTMTWAFALISIAATGDLATAQPDPMAPPPGDPVEPAPEPMEPPRPPDPPPPVAAPESTGDANADRPEGLAIGIGLGYLLPSSLETPNITSVRVRLAGGLTLEPQVVLGNTTVKREAADDDEKDSSTELTIAAGMRLPLVRHGKVELELLASVGLSNQTDNPDGADNNRKITAIALGWGVGVSYWYSRHWCISFAAGNPLVSFTKVTNEQPEPLDETSTTTTAIGAIFDPTVAIMIHLFN